MLLSCSAAATRAARYRRLLGGETRDLRAATMNPQPIHLAWTSTAPRRSRASRAAARAPRHAAGPPPQQGICRRQVRSPSKTRPSNLNRSRKHPSLSHSEEVPVDSSNANPFDEKSERKAVGEKERVASWTQTKANPAQTRISFFKSAGSSHTEAPQR